MEKLQLFSPILADLRFWLGFSCRFSCYSRENRFFAEITSLFSS